MGNYATLARPMNTLSHSMQLTDFHYHLPDELIARYPTEQRTDSRLLVLDGASGAIEHRAFTDLPDYLQAGDLLVFNNTRVLPARLWGRKVTGGRVEVLVERVLDAHTVLAHVRASKALKAGAEIELLSDAEGERVEARATVLGREDALFRLQFDGDEGALGVMSRIGHMPLPPYIDRQDEVLDRERYQTVYGCREGAVAAPTAGLHFSEAFIERCKAKGVGVSFVTLHVGAGTFQPVRVAKIEEHRMHAEYIEVGEEVCAAVRATRERGGRVVAIGTTSVRSLESASTSGSLQPFAGDSDIFIYPGYQFRSVDAMVTNFHLPESTLIMLVSAFAGREHILEAYRQAVEQRYRFFSYGDAMLIFPGQ